VSYVIDMADFKKFMAVWLSIIVLGTILTAGTIRLLSDNSEQTEQNNVATQHGNHFSVRWMGFAPTDFNSSYPEYCVCINGLKANPLKMQIAFQIKNQEDRGYYFFIGTQGTPPESWVILSYQIGYIDVDNTKRFIYENASRELPSSIPSGRLTETITLVVKAYYDDQYSSLYSEDDVYVTFNFIDRLSSAWTTQYKDDFDDGVDTHGWSACYDGGVESSSGYSASVSASDDYYRSFQYSLKLSAGAYGYTYAQYVWSGTYWYWQYTYYAGWIWAGYTKTFVTPSASEVYLLFSIRSSNWDTFKQRGIMINGTTYFKSDVDPQPNAWYQFAIPLRSNCTNIVSIWASYLSKSGSGWAWTYSYLDNVYVIAK